MAKEMKEPHKITLLRRKAKPPGERKREMGLFRKSSNNLGNGHVVIRTSHTMKIKEKKRERGGEIVKVTPAKGSSKTKDWRSSTHETA